MKYHKTQKNLKPAGNCPVSSNFCIISLDIPSCFILFNTACFGNFIFNIFLYFPNPSSAAGTGAGAGNPPPPPGASGNCPVNSNFCIILIAIPSCFILFNTACFGNFIFNIFLYFPNPSSAAGTGAGAGNPPPPGIGAGGGKPPPPFGGGNPPPPPLGGGNPPPVNGGGNPPPPPNPPYHRFTVKVFSK